MEIKSEVPIIKDTGDGAVYPSAFLGKRIWGGRNPGEDPASKDSASVWKHADAVSKTETHRTSETLLFLFVSDGGISEEAQADSLCSAFRYSEAGPKDLPDGVFAKRRDYHQGRAGSIPETLGRTGTFFDERELYRKKPGGMRIREINGELKELRKRIRLSQQIEKQSLEMEERLRQAKEQEEVQEVSGKQRREAERNR